MSSFENLIRPGRQSASRSCTQGQPSRSALWPSCHGATEDAVTTAARISGRYKPEGEWPPPSPEEVPDEAADVEASGLFENVQIRRYLWEKTYTAEGYIALLDTLSNHIAMEAPKRE